MDFIPYSMPTADIVRYHGASLPAVVVERLTEGETETERLQSIINDMAWELPDRLHECKKGELLEALQAIKAALAKARTD